MDARRRGAAAWRRSAARVTAWTVTTATMAALGAAPTAAATIVPSGTLVPVVVQGAPDAAAAEVTRLGGVVDQRPAVVDGVPALVPVRGIVTLARIDGVRAVAPDGVVVPGR